MVSHFQIRQNFDERKKSQEAGRYEVIKAAKDRYYDEVMWME